jgi:sulfonate transport system ATP-binding protein
LPDLIQFTKGKIKYNNQRITGTSLERCIVFQEQRLLQWLNVNDNIAFALPVSMRRNEKRKKVAEAIELVNLTGFGNVYPSQLSGGMQQRVALARAMVNLPEMLLLDEPYGALDSITRDKMQKELMRIVSKANATVLMVTHDIDEAIIMSDKIFVLGGNPTNIKKAIQIERSKVNEKTAMEFIKIRNQLINELYKN